MSREVQVRFRESWKRTRPQGGHLAARPTQWKAAWCLHAAGDPAAEDWVAVKALAVLAADSARAAGITAEADAANLTTSQRTGADACVRYLTGKHEYLRYDQTLTEDGPSPPGSSKEPALT